MDLPVVHRSVPSIAGHLSQISHRREGQFDTQWPSWSSHPRYVVQDIFKISVADILLTVTPSGSFPFLTNYPELTLNYWAQKFGSLYSLWLGNQLFMIISDPQIVKDLMVTNGSIFSSRKEMFLKSQIIFVGRGITAMPYDNRWQAYFICVTKNYQS
jgi:hypothetical protein